MSVTAGSVQTQENQVEPQGSFFSASEAFVHEYGYLLPSVDGNKEQMTSPKAAALILGYTNRDTPAALDLYYMSERSREGLPGHRWQVLHRLKVAGKPLIEVDDIFASERSVSSWVASRTTAVARFDYRPATLEITGLVVDLLQSWNFSQSVHAVLKQRAQGRARLERLKDTNHISSGANGNPSPIAIGAPLAGFERQTRMTLTRVSLLDF